MLSMDSLISVQNSQPGYKNHWLYTDNSIPVMCVARYDQGKDKTFRQFIPDQGDWLEGMCSAPYPLYGLSTLANPLCLDSIIITEGEKNCSLVHQLGWPALTTVLGSSNPDKSDWTPLRHFNRYIILRDNDKPGIDYTRSVSRLLRSINPDCQVFVVNLCSSSKGGDLIDWAQATVLLGSQWDEYSPLKVPQIESLKSALEVEIKKQMVEVEQCPKVGFKPIEACFSGEPQELELKLHPVPSFPLEVFPTDIAEFLRIQSAQVSQVPDFAATILLLVVAGLIGRSIQLKMRPNGTWIEVANAWGCIVGSPSSKKSPIMRTIMNLLRPLENKAQEEYQQAFKAYKAKQREGKENGEEFDECLPTLRRYITDDTTTPKLRELFAGNPRGLILRNDELKGQLDKLDKPGAEGDRSFLMNCWSGLECYSEDRMCRESQINIPPALTWVGCIPPTALQKYLREAMGRGSGADGFMQRFQFVCYPDTIKEFTLSEEEIPSDLHKQIYCRLENLDKQSQAEFMEIVFSPEAQDRFDQWLIAHETDSRSGRHPVYWESHLGKQAKLVAVACIVLHSLDESIKHSPKTEVSIGTLEKALSLQKYYEAHALRCYESICGSILEDARAILRILREKRIATRFKAQDSYRSGIGGFEDGARVKAALELLEDKGWLVREKVSSSGNGGRGHEFWNLHPRAFSKE